MTLHNYRHRQVHETSNGVNPSSGFRDMRSAKSGPNLCQIFGPWASPYGANGQMTMTVHNYMPKQLHRTSDGENPSSNYRDMGSASLAAVRPPTRPPACPDRDNNTPSSPEDWGVKHWRLVISLCKSFTAMTLIWTLLCQAAQQYQPMWRTPCLWPDPPANLCKGHHGCALTHLPTYVKDTMAVPWPTCQPMWMTPCLCPDPPANLCEWHHVCALTHLPTYVKDTMFVPWPTCQPMWMTPCLCPDPPANLCEGHHGCALTHLPTYVKDTMPVPWPTCQPMWMTPCLCPDPSANLCKGHHACALTHLPTYVKDTMSVPWPTC